MGQRNAALDIPRLVRILLIPKRLFTAEGGSLFLLTIMLRAGSPDTWLSLVIFITVMTPEGM